MYEDIEALVALVRREVAETELAGRPAWRLRAARDVPGPADDAWAALTDAERLSRWLAPVSGVLRPGGSYRLEGLAGGTIEACEPGRRIAATWTGAAAAGRIDVALAPAAGGGVHLALDHVARADPDRWRTFGPAVIGVGWDLALLGLARHLAAPRAAPPQDWVFSDEGRVFARQSASAWGEAAAAAGQDRLQALEAAARAAQIYAGEGSDAG